LALGLAAAASPLAAALAAMLLAAMLVVVVVVLRLGLGDRGARRQHSGDRRCREEFHLGAPFRGATSRADVTSPNWLLSLA
jgi:hypothetical protein